MDKNIVIREYQADDRLQVQNICIATGGDFAQRADMRPLLLSAFCNYYIEKEPENCFVAADGGRVVGYILCAADCNCWVKDFRSEYVDRAPAEEVKRFYEGTMATPQKFAESYPAHLHIDILPEYQRMGIGFKLMNALIGHLKGRGVPGLMLSVAGDNTKGINFYEKYGFTVLERTSYEIAMGIPLSEKEYKI